MICLQVKKLRRDYNEKKKNETMAAKNIEKPISFSAESPNFKAGLKRTSTMAFERTVQWCRTFWNFSKLRWIPSQNRVKTVRFLVKGPLSSIDSPEIFCNILHDGLRPTK